MICPNCGQDYSGNFCTNCGYGANAQPAGNFQTVTVEKRDIARCVIFSIITIGIYAFYWMYKLNTEVNVVSNEQNGTDSGMVILLTIVTIGIYGIYWAYKAGERVDRIHTMRGVPVGNNAVIYLICTLFGFSIVALALMQNELNQYA